MNDTHPLEYRQQPPRSGPTLLRRLPYIVSGVIIGTLIGLVAAGQFQGILHRVFDFIFGRSWGPNRQWKEAVAGMVLTVGCILLGWIVGGWVGNYWARRRSVETRSKP